MELITFLSVITAPEYATIEETVINSTTGVEETKRREHLIEPLTNYFVGRIQQDVLMGIDTGYILLANSGDLNLSQFQKFELADFIHYPISLCGILLSGQVNSHQRR